MAGAFACGAGSSGSSALPIAFNALVQLFRQCLLRFRVDVPEDRVAVCLVPYDDAPIPAPIVTFSDHPVPGWPPISHMQNSYLSWLFSNNYHAGDRIATSRAESYQKIIISVFFVYGSVDFEPHYSSRFSSIHSAIPVSVGSRNASSVHRTLPVSFLIVSSVVLHGQ